MHDYGLLTLLPVLVVIVLATITRSSFEPLIAGILVGCVIAYQGDFLNKFIENLSNALTDKTSGWVIVVCMLYGSLIMMMIRSGGTVAFSNFPFTVCAQPKNSAAGDMDTWVNDFCG